MVSSYTPNKRIEKPANGDYNNTWSAPVNDDWDIIDKAFGGTTIINAVGASGTVVLTAAQYRPPIITINGALTANVNYQLPAGVGGFFYIFNNTSGAFSVLFSSAGGGSTVTLPRGYTIAVISDGTNIGLGTTNAALISSTYADPAWITSLATSKLTGTVSIANGGTGQTTAPLARTALAAAASGANTDITSISPTGSLTFNPTTGTLVGAPTGGAQGAGTINATGLFVNGAAVGTSTGTVSIVSVTSANGFAGTVANANSTPAITLTTTITGVLKGNGTAISAAVAGTDYLVPGGALGTPSSGTLTNCTFPTLNQNTTGSAATLTTARTLTIGSTGKTFNGSANVAWTLAEIGAAASGANTDITALDQDITITATGTIAANTIGYRGLPQNAQTASYTLALSDAGKHISITTGGVVVPANSSIAFPIGSAISVYNDSASSQTISITTDTMYLAGTATTGSRTLAQRGIATILKVAATTWVISGGGLS